MYDAFCLQIIIIVLLLNFDSVIMNVSADFHFILLITVVTEREGCNYKTMHKRDAHMLIYV